MAVSEPASFSINLGMAWTLELDNIGIITLGGGNSNILYFHPGSLGKRSILTFAYFSKGLVQPPTRKILGILWMG